MQPNPSLTDQMDIQQEQIFFAFSLLHFFDKRLYYATIVLYYNYQLYVVFCLKEETL